MNEVEYIKKVGKENGIDIPDRELINAPIYEDLLNKVQDLIRENCKGNESGYIVNLITDLEEVILDEDLLFIISHLLDEYKKRQE